jgi:anti-sigma factor RsiW
MSCELEKELTAYVDGELPDIARARVDAHLSTCAGCRATEQLLRRTVSTLVAMEPAFAPSAALKAKVLSALDRPVGLRQRLEAWLRPGVLIPSGLGLAAAAAGLTAVVVTRESPPRFELVEPSHYELIANLEVVEDYEVLGLEEPDDVELVSHLHELEKLP